MRIRRHLVDLCIGLLVTLVLFGAIEGALALMGLGKVSGGTNLSRGFDSTAAYLVPDPEHGGGYLTRFYNGENKEHQIPRKGDAKRVVLFGGSNTRGFQKGRLPQALDALADGEFEVVNLGRSGYGSARVAIAFEQALDRLAPDVVVIYMGHNEFVEAGFQLDLENEWSSDTMKAVGEFMRSTRIVNLITDALEENRVSVQNEPAAWSWEYDKFSDLTYDGTLEVFAHYESRLNAMCEMALDRGVGVVLCTVVYNRFSVPHVSNFPADTDVETRARFQELFTQAGEDLTASIRALLPTEEQARVHIKNWTDSDGSLPRELWDRELPGRRACTGPFASQDPMFGDPQGFARHIWDLYDNLELFLERHLEGDERERLERAERNLRAALELVPDHPRALFTLGLVEYVLGRPEADIREHIEQGHRFDRAPRKGNRAINGIIRRTAEAHPDVVFLDVDERFADDMPMRLTGWEWMVDHCHLNVGARIVAMRMLAEVVAEEFGDD